MLGAINAGQTFAVSLNQQSFYPARAVEPGQRQESSAFARDIGIQEPAESPASEAGIITVPTINSTANAEKESQADSKKNEAGKAAKDENTPKADGEDAKNEDRFAGKGVDGNPLTASEKLHLQKLRSIDTAVRAHEQAHLSAAGGLAVSGASFKYQRGEDGRNYAVAGEVSINTGKESSPDATVAKMQRVRAAALAPADPSAQDQNVASQASRVMIQAQGELLELRNVEVAEARDSEKEEEEDKTEAVEEDKNNVEETDNQAIELTIPDLSFPWAEAASSYKSISKSTEAFFPDDLKVNIRV